MGEMGHRKQDRVSDPTGAVCTAKQAPAGTTYYAYDTENLMTRIDFADGSHCYYSYDADGKQVSQRTPDGYTEFIYQGPDMLKLQMERDEAGNTRVQYTMGAGLESMRRDAGGGMASGDSSFFHYNHLGTTIALTNPAQSVTDTYRHDAWGVLLAQSYTGGEPTVNPHTYVGQQRYYRMPEPDFYHLGFRDYGPRVGRFTTVDPARQSGPPFCQSASASLPRYSTRLVTGPRLGLGSIKPHGGCSPLRAAADSYAYVGGNPVVRTDPSGRWFQIVICGIILGCIVITLPGCPPRDVGDGNGGDNDEELRQCDERTAREDPAWYLDNCPVDTWEGSYWMDACGLQCLRSQPLAAGDCGILCCAQGIDPRTPECYAAMTRPHPLP